MRTRAGLAATAGALLALALTGCGGGDSTSGSGAGGDAAGGTPACSAFANGEVITEQLTLAGCTGDGVSSIALNTCPGGVSLVAVGPVYGIVGQPAMYLGDGQDATKSSEWADFQKACPAAGSSSGG